MWLLLLADETVVWVEAEDVCSRLPFQVPSSWTTVIDRPRGAVTSGRGSGRRLTGNETVTYRPFMSRAGPDQRR